MIRGIDAPGERRRLKDPDDPPLREDFPFISGRLLILLALFLLVMGLFGARLYQLTILQGPFFASESENNFRTQVPIIAPRGRILDAHGRPLAINHPLFDVEMSPFGLDADEITSTVTRLAGLLDRPEITGKTDAVIRRRPRWKSVKMIEGIKLDDALPLLEQAFDLPGTIVTPHYTRNYPAGDVAGLVTGHVGAIDPRQLPAYLERGYLRNEKIGKLAIERTFERLLHGENGLEIVFRDARGRPRSRFVETPARPGHTLILTLDLELQRLADALLEGSRGAIVVMDPRDGAVLAMVQRPAYDPNRPGRGYSFNKITKGTFPPGSIFKVVTAAAGLRAGRSPLEEADCDGLYHVPGVDFRFPCHLKWGHGTLDMYGALQKSCNVYFFRWAHKAGYAAMEEMSLGFGFGLPTDFELAAPGQEKPGIVGHAQVLLGNRLQMGIGQGRLIDITPIQMIRAYCALVNGGTLYRPRIIREIRSSIGERLRIEPYGGAQVQGEIPLSEEHRRQILEGLRRVVHERGGTGSRVGFNPEWRVAGKTGTAQTGRPEGEPHAWFACYAPYENPEIAVLVLVEESGHGGDVAAPLARQLLAHYFGAPESQIVSPIMKKQQQEEAEG